MYKRQVLHETGLDVVVQLDVVDAVPEHASLWDHRPSKATLLVSVDDGLAGEARTIGRVLFAHPHGQLAFAGPGRDVGAESGMSNEDLPVFAFGEVYAADEGTASLAFDPGFDVLGVSGLVNFANANTNLSLVGRQRVFLIAEARESCASRSSTLRV